MVSCILRPCFMFIRKHHHPRFTMEDAFPKISIDEDCNRDYNFRSTHIRKDDTKFSHQRSPLRRYRYFLSEHKHIQTAPFYNGLRSQQPQSYEFHSYPCSQTVHPPGSLPHEYTFLHILLAGQPLSNMHFFLKPRQLFLHVKRSTGPDSPLIELNLHVGGHVVYASRWPVRTCMSSFLC